MRVKQFDPEHAKNALNRRSHVSVSSFLSKIGADPFIREVERVALIRVLATFTFAACRAAVLGVAVAVCMLLEAGRGAGVENARRCDPSPPPPSSRPCAGVSAPIVDVRAVIVAIRLSTCVFMLSMLDSIFVRHAAVSEADRMRRSVVASATLRAAF